MTSTELTTYEPRDLGELRQFSQEVTATALVPQHYRNKPADAMVAMMFGREVAGLGPLISLNCIAVINGRPAFYGDAVPGIALNKGLITDMEESFEGKPYDDDFTAVCIVTRQSGTKVTQRFSVADARKAGLWGKAGPWQQYPKRMLQWRARSWAIRDAAPHMLFGPTVEELRDIDDEHRGPERAKNVTPKTTAQPLAAPEYVALYDAWGAEYLVAPGEVEQWLRDQIEGTDDAALPDLAAANPEREDVQSAVAAALPAGAAQDERGEAAPAQQAADTPAPAGEAENGGKREADLQQRQAKMIAGELKKAKLADRPAIWMKHWPVIEGLRPRLRQRLEQVRDEGAPDVQPAEPAPEPTFDDDIAALEPSEWQQARLSGVE